MSKIEYNTIIPLISDNVIGQGLQETLRVLNRLSYSSFFISDKRMEK